MEGGEATCSEGGGGEGEARGEEGRYKGADAV